jgi:hypothetical protein
MQTSLSTRLVPAVLKAARPARRQIVRALRHHAARTRALAIQWRDARPADSIRTWFLTFFAALRTRAGSRRFSLRTLLHRPTPHEAARASRTGSASPRSAGAIPRTGNAAPRAVARRPQRLAAASGWYGFAAR